MLEQLKARFVQFVLDAQFYVDIKIYAVYFFHLFFTGLWITVSIVWRIALESSTTVSAGTRALLFWKWNRYDFDLFHEEWIEIMKNKTTVMDLSYLRWTIETTTASLIMITSSSTLVIIIVMETSIVTILSCGNEMRLRLTSIPPNPLDSLLHHNL